jgi:hypothetical protein
MESRDRRLSSAVWNCLLGMMNRCRPTSRPSAWWSSRRGTCGAGIPSCAVHLRDRVQDAEDGTPVQLASAATVQGVFDRSVAVGSTRWYGHVPPTWANRAMSAWLPHAPGAFALRSAPRHFTQSFTNLTPTAGEFGRLGG